MSPSARQKRREECATCVPTLQSVRIGIENQRLEPLFSDRVDLASKNCILNQESDAIDKAVSAITESTSRTELLALRDRFYALRDARENTLSLFEVSKRKSEIFNAHAFLLMSGLVAMMLAMVSGIAIGYARPQTTLLTRPFSFVLVVWVSMAAYFAICESTFIKEGVVLTGDGLKNAPSDTVWLDNDRHLRGTVVRSLEKGAIIRDATNSSLLFVPREKIYRIDLQR